MVPSLTVWTTSLCLGILAMLTSKHFESPCGDDSAQTSLDQMAGLAPVAIAKSGLEKLVPRQETRCKPNGKVDILS